MEIYCIGGFNEVGKNMTVVDLGEDAFIFDMGVYLPAIVEMQEESEDLPQVYSEKKLREIGALPDDKQLDKLGITKKIRGIFIGHGHLDHVGAVPYIARKYNAPVIGTPYTISVLKRIMKDENIKIPNKIQTVNPNSSITLKGKNKSYNVDFINITHSIPQTSMIALETDEGYFVYANDFKLDNTPVLGLPPNYNAMKKIAKKGVNAVVVDSLYSGEDKKTPSEKVARALLEEVLLTINNKNSAIFVSTFSSHIARIKSIVDFSKKLGREVFVIGRSMNKYISAAEDAGICPFKKDIKIGSYKKQVQSMLKKVAKDRSRYLVICTGHQGEQGSIMDQLSKKKLPFEFKNNDNIVFSSKTIPVPINIANKENMDKRLKKTGVRLFDDVHVSGHGGREDLRDFISMIKPKHIIPSHGSTQQLIPMVELAKELGYNVGKEVHLVQDGQKLKL